MLTIFGARNEKRTNSTLSLPRANVRNIPCIQCKRQFYLKDFCPLQGSVPLLLQCGHVICDPCSKTISQRLCPLCTSTSESTNNNESQLPLNIYGLGLMMLSYNRPVQTDEPEISFQQPIYLKPRQMISHGQCSECGIHAHLFCLDCEKIFCIACYTKIHSRALKAHKRINLSENDSDGSFLLRTTCTEVCNDALRYYCKDCEVSTCLLCIVQRHAKHNFVELKCKNEQHWDEFEMACQCITDGLSRIEQVQKKIKAMLAFPAKLQSNEREEAEITQHFAQLHGVLQNMEERLLSQIHGQRNYHAKNLEELSTQLKHYRDELETALMLAVSARDNVDRVDLMEVTRSLQKVADIPCHLVRDLEPQDQKMQFSADKSIIEQLEKHCRLKVPPVSGFSLLPENLLPEGYEIEPLVQEALTPRSLGRSSISLKSSTLYVSPADQFTQSGSTIPSEGSTDLVRITHIVDPSWFYVQQVSSQRKIIELEKGLTSLANSAATVPKEVMLNKLYLVQRSKDKKWYRGRVMVLNETNDKFNVFFVDYGMTEENVIISQLRTIPPQYATLPTMALRCALCDIVPRNGKWEKNATEQFSKLLTSDVISMAIKTICGDTYYVDLCTMPYSSSVKDTLIFLKLGCSISPHQLLKMNPKSVRKYYTERLPLDKFSDVRVLFVESPSCIYVQPMHDSNKESMRKMFNDMRTEYEQNASLGFIHQPEKGLPCAARGVNGYWYRAIICDVSPENTVKLFFVDLGYTQQQSSDTIRTLHDKFMTNRTQAIKVSLNKIAPPSGKCDDWSVDAIEFVNECISNLYQTVRLIALRKVEDGYSVVIYINGNKNLASLLVKKGLAKYTSPSKKSKKDKTLSNKMFTKRGKEGNMIEDLPYDMEFEEQKDSALLKESEDPFKVSVLVHRVDSPDCICVSRSKCEEANAELMSEMQLFYKNHHCEPRKHWTKDAICAVYSEKDKAFCRAKILDVKSPDEVSVFFYDTAIEDTVPVKHIHPLCSRFSQISAYIFKIKLAGILPCGGSSTWPSSSIEKLQEIMNENQHCKFFISKTEESDDFIIPVELWIRQAKMDGPFAPTRIEINSVNRMLVEEGVALPIKDYAIKRDKILAIELERQLKRRRKAMQHFEEHVKWYKNDGDEGSCVEIDFDKSMSTILAESEESSSEHEDSCSESSPTHTLPLPPKLAAWIPPAPIQDDHFIAIPTYIDDHCTIYLHPKGKYEKTLEYIETKLCETYNNCKIKKCDKEWSPGDLCIALYHANKKWYRAQVLRIESNVIYVQFVDYGNVEEYVVGSLKKKVTLGHIPIQSTKCKVHGLIPNNDSGVWSTSDIDTIHGVLVDQPCEVTVLKREQEFLTVQITLQSNAYRKEKCDLVAYLIDKYDLNIKPLCQDDTEMGEGTMPSVIEITADFINNDINVSEKITKEKLETDNSKHIDNSVICGNTILIDHHCSDKETGSERSTDIDNVSWANIKDFVTTSTPQLWGSAENISPYKEIEIPKEITTIEIELSSALEATQFFAQLRENSHSKELNEYRTLYERMMVDLQENAHKQSLINPIYPNTPCCTQYMDKVWYRCLIRDAYQIDKETVSVTLFYVDFGNDEERVINMTQHDLYSLKDEWLEIPMMIRKFQLWNIDTTPDVDLNVVAERLDPLINLPVIAKIKQVTGNVIHVEIFENEHSEVVIYDSMIQDADSYHKDRNGTTLVTHLIDNTI